MTGRLLVCVCVGENECVDVCVSGYQGSDIEYRRRVMELAVTFPINQLGSVQGERVECVHKTACSLMCVCVFARLFCVCS